MRLAIFKDKNEGDSAIDDPPVDDKACTAVGGLNPLNIYRNVLVSRKDDLLFYVEDLTMSGGLTHRMRIELGRVDYIQKRIIDHHDAFATLLER